MLNKTAAPDFISTTPKPLDKSVDTWGQTVLGDIKAWGGLPPEASLDFQVIKEDREQGAAVGSVIMNVAGQPVNIPVVVHEHKLLPMDTMEIGGEHYPLTKKRLAERFMTASPYRDETYRPDQVHDYGQDLRRVVVPPTYRGGIGKYSAEGAAAIEELVPRMISSARRGQAYKELMLPIDENLIRNYRANGTHDVIMGLLKKPDGDIEVTQTVGQKMESHAPGAETRISWVPKPTEEDIGAGFVTVLGASGKSFDPALMRVPCRDITRLYSNPHGIDPALRSLLVANMHDLSFPRISGTDVGPYPAADMGIMELNAQDLDFKNFSVLTSDGELKECDGFIPALKDPFSPGASKIGATCGYGGLVVGDRFFGVLRDGEGAGRNVQDGYVNSNPDNREGGFFYCAEGCCPSYGPFEVSAKTTYPIETGGTRNLCTAYQIHRGPMGMKVLVCGVFKAPVEAPGTLSLPAHMKFRNANNVYEACNSPAEVGYLAKLAHENLGDWLKAYSVDNGRSIALELPDTIKTAYVQVLDEAGIDSRFTGLEPKVAMFLITAAGVHSDDANAIIKTAQVEPVTVYGVHYLPPKRSAEKIAMSAEQRTDLVRSVWANLVKEAAFIPPQTSGARVDGAYFPTTPGSVAAVLGLPALEKGAAVIPDRKTVDAILGLGLVDEGNIEDYVEAVPLYQEVVQGLAKMLPRARVYGGPMHESVIRKAMAAVENMLEQVQVFLESQRVLKSPQNLGL